MDDDYSEEQICCICEKPFTEEEWENRHWLHEDGCDRTGNCTCDLECHEECCPECNGSTKS